MKLKNTTLNTKINIAGSPQLKSLVDQNSKLMTQIRSSSKVLLSDSNLHTPVENTTGSTKPPTSINDLILIGGYRVVRTIEERDAIDCCYRKIGMRVMVVGPDYSFIDYDLKGEDPCSNEFWSQVEYDNVVTDEDVQLSDDYTFIWPEEEIETQKQLNRVLIKALQDLVKAVHETADKHYVHDQATPSSVWRIVHNLDKHPTVTVTDTAGSIVEGYVDYTNKNEITITFNAPFSGKAYLN